MQNVSRRPIPVFSQSPVSLAAVRLLQALRQAIAETIRQHMPLILMALVYIRHGRYQMERASEPSGMAKATLIVLGGLAILGAALFIAWRVSAGKITTQMNADY